MQLFTALKQVDSTNQCCTSWSRSRWAEVDLSYRASLCHQELPEPCDRDRVATALHGTIQTLMIIQTSDW